MVTEAKVKKLSVQLSVS